MRLGRGCSDTSFSLDGVVAEDAEGAEDLGDRDDAEEAAAIVRGECYSKGIRVSYGFVEVVGICKNKSTFDASTMVTVV